MSHRLLVVDDEPLNLEIIAEYLEDSGYEYDLVESGESAWENLIANAPSYYAGVILDRMMPGLDGMSLLRRIKADARTQNLPVIMQTAAGSTEQVREGLEAGAYYYLVKPFHADTLLLIIRTALEDRERWHALSDRIAHHGLALSLIRHGVFEVTTLEEADALASFLGVMAENPDAVTLGLSELMVNGIEHGNLGIDFEAKSELKKADNWAEEIYRRQKLPEYADKRVAIEVQCEGSVCRVVIRDEGKGFQWQEFLEMSPERAFAPNGRGIALSRLMAFSSMEYQGCGNTVEVVFPAKAGGNGKYE